MSAPTAGDIAGTTARGKAAYNERRRRLANMGILDPRPLRRPFGLDPLLNAGAWLEAERLGADNAELDSLIELNNAAEEPKPDFIRESDRRLAEEEPRNRNRAHTAGGG